MKHVFSKKRLIKAVLWLAIVGIVAYFFIRTLIDNWQRLEGVNLSFNGWSVAAILLFAVAVASSGMLWGDILNRLAPEKHITLRESARVHIMSWLLKYIPGQAGSFVSKIMWGKRHGYSKKLVSITFIYENAFLLLASLIGSLPVVAILFRDQFFEGIATFVPLLLAVPLLAVLQKDVFYHVINFAFKKLRGQEIDRAYFLNTPQLAGYTLKFLVPRLITAAAFLCVVASLVPIPPEAYIGLAAIYILAGIVGLMAFFVPSGLGVREAVIVLFATAYFSVEVAIVLALAARFYATLADALLALIYVIIRKRGEKV